MKNLLHSLVVAFFISATLVCAPQNASAQDPTKVDPDNYKVLYEDNSVRILEFHDSPGDKVPKHSHPNYFVYVISDATRLFTNWTAATDCNGKGNTVVLKAGESLTKPPVTHCEANTGTTNTHLIVVEFKYKPRITPKSKGRRRH